MDLIECAKGWQRDTVIAAQRDQLRDPPILDLRILISSRRSTMRQIRERLGHLAERQRVVDGCDGDVAAVEEGGPAGVGVDARAGVVAAGDGLAGGGCADGAGAEACAGAVGDSCVEGGAEDGDVVGGFGVLEAAGVGEVGEGVNAGEAVLEDLLDG